MHPTPHYPDAMGQCASRSHPYAGVVATTGALSLKRKREDTVVAAAAADTDVPAAIRPPASEMSRLGTLLQLFWCLDQMSLRSTSLTHGCMEFVVDTLRDDSNVRLWSQSSTGEFLLVKLLNQLFNVNDTVAYLDPPTAGSFQSEQYESGREDVSEHVWVPAVKAALREHADKWFYNDHSASGTMEMNHRGVNYRYHHRLVRELHDFLVRAWIRNTKARGLSLTVRRDSLYEWLILRWLQVLNTVGRLTFLVEHGVDLSQCSAIHSCLRNVKFEWLILEAASLDFRGLDVDACLAPDTVDDSLARSWSAPMRQSRAKQVQAALVSVAELPTDLAAICTHYLDGLGRPHDALTDREVERELAEMTAPVPGSAAALALADDVQVRFPPFDD